MLMHPLPNSKLTFWQLVKSIFSTKSPEPPPSVGPGKTLPKKAEETDHKTTVFPRFGDF